MSSFPAQSRMTIQTLLLGWIMFQRYYAMNSILTHQKPANVLVTWDKGFWEAGDRRNLCGANITKDLWWRYVNRYVCAKGRSSVTSFHTVFFMWTQHVPKNDPRPGKKVRWKQWTGCLWANTGRLLCVSTDCSDEKCWPTWETLYQSNIKLNIQRNLKGRALLPGL